jgi:hypothetical protein
MLEEQEWSNFKDEVRKTGDMEYEKLLHKVWNVMLDLQLGSRNGFKPTFKQG